jgi:hypothetical protein
MKDRLVLGMAAGIAFSLVASRAQATALNSNDLIVSWAGYPASYVQEYTPSGTLVQSWKITATFSTEYARGVAVDNLGNIIIYNGTFSPSLSILNPSTGSMTNYSSPGWNNSNTTIQGSVAVSGGFAYAQDQQISGDSANQSGIVRFKLSDGTSQRFLAGTIVSSLSLGLNNKLYAVWPDTSPGDNELTIVDATTMAVIKTVNLPMGFSGATADAAGNIFATSGSTIYEMNESAQILKSLDTGFAVDNIKISPTGQLVMANNGGQIVMSTTDLSSFTEFTLNEPNQQLFASFANFAVPVPEPTTAVVGALTGALLLCRRRRARI